jgi:hypothetical protein
MTSVGTLKSAQRSRQSYPSRRRRAATAAAARLRGVAERARVESLGHGFWQVKLSYGFTEDADVPAALEAIVACGNLAPPTQ